MAKAPAFTACDDGNDFPPPQGTTARTAGSERQGRSLFTSSLSTRLLTTSPIAIGSTRQSTVAIALARYRHNCHRQIPTSSATAPQRSETAIMITSRSGFASDVLMKVNSAVSIVSRYSHILEQAP